MERRIWRYSVSGTCDELAAALGVTRQHLATCARQGNDCRGLEVTRRALVDDGRDAVAAISDEARERLRGLLS